MNINCSVYCPAAPQTYLPYKEQALLQICDFWDRLKTSQNAPFCDMAMPIQVWNVRKSLILGVSQHFKALWSLIFYDIRCTNTEEY